MPMAMSVLARASSALRCRATIAPLRALPPLRCLDTVHAPSWTCRRHCSSDAAAKEDSPPANGAPALVYEGAKNKIVLSLKKVSIGNLGFAVASMPILQYITSASGSPGKGVAMSALLIFFGGGTTGMLTWATSTYVMKIMSVPGKDAVAITTPTLMGGERETEVAWADIQRPVGYHPFATFEAAGAARCHGRSEHTPRTRARAPLAMLQLHRCARPIRLTSVRAPHAAR